MCLDFPDLNKVCPKDSFMLARIDQIVDSTARCNLLCFLDAYSGYQQTCMAKEDEDKTTFITSLELFAIHVMARYFTTFIRDFDVVVTKFLIFLASF